MELSDNYCFSLFSVVAFFNYELFFGLNLLINTLELLLTSGTHAQAHATKPVRGEEVGREEGAKVGSGRAGRGG